MESAKTIGQLLLVALSIYIAFFKSYASEKGKNLATQEDIGEITKIVEQIRTDLAKDTELLKANLSLYNQNKFSIKSAERDALFALSKAYSAWLYSLMNFSFLNYDEDNVTELEGVYLQYDNKKYEFDLARSQLKLFMLDDEIITLIRDLTIVTLNLEHSIISHIRRYKHKYTLYNISRNGNPTGDIITLYKELQKDIQPIIKQFHSDRNEIFEKVVIEETKLGMLIKKRIDSIKE